jgi:hypothetical protein
MNIRTNAASTAEEITAIQELMNDLEKRLRRLSGETSREFTGGSAEISDFVSDTLTGIKERVRAGVHSVSQAATDKNAHLGSDALKKSHRGDGTTPTNYAGHRNWDRVYFWHVPALKSADHATQPHHRNRHQ